MTAIPILLLAVLLLGFLPNSGFPLFLKLLVMILIGGGAFFYRDHLQEDDQYSGDENDPDDRYAAVDVRSVDVSAVEAPAEPPEKSVEAHFEQFLETVFPLIKQTVVANSVVLLMVNYFKSKFYTRYHISEFETSFSSDKFFDLSQGLPGIVLKDRKALLENNLPANSNLVPYYQGPDMPVKAFLAVPLQFDNFIAGVLCVDSSVADSFSREDLEILQAFGKAVEIQLASSNQLYEYETKNWTARLLYDFSKDILNIREKKDLWQYVSQCLLKLFSADRVIISEAIGSGQAKIVFNSGGGGEKEPLVESQFPDNEGIIGWVLRKNQPMVVDDFREKENYIPRYLLSEPADNTYRSLLAVPVTHAEKAVAAISIESRKKQHFSDQHKKILETMSNQISGFLDKLEMIHQLRSENLVDTTTRRGNSKALIYEVEKEIHRSRQFNKTFSLQIIRMDLNGKSVDLETFNKLVREFLAIIEKQLNCSNYLYRLDKTEFAILWPEKRCPDLIKQIQEAHNTIAGGKFWAEGFVEQLAAVSGMAEFPRHGGIGNDLLRNARGALSAAQNIGPGAVTIFEESQPASQPKETRQ